MMAFRISGHYLAGASLPPNPMKSARKRPTAAKLRSWRVSIIRSRGESVEAPDRERAEAVAIKQFALGPGTSGGGS